MCIENNHGLLALDFSSTVDEGNWSVSEINSSISTNSGKLVFNSGSSTNKFERVLGIVEPSNNRLRIKTNIEIEKKIGSSPLNLEFDFNIKSVSTGQILFTSKVSLTSILGGKIYSYLIDRTFEYNNDIGEIKLSIEMPYGFDNWLRMKDLEVFDFNYCVEKIRTYFVLDEFFDTTKTPEIDGNGTGSGAIQLLKWQVDNIETLTDDYFLENGIVVGNETLFWKFAKADLDGKNRISELYEPNIFNPFIVNFGLDFDSSNYFSGKPTGTTTGSDYGLGVMEIGTDKPIILNSDLVEKKAPFFIDIDYTKNLKVVFNVIANTNVNDNTVFNEPEMYREYTIEWNSETCTKSFSYKDKLVSGEPVFDESKNGFLSGLAPFIETDIVIEEEIPTEIVWSDTETNENRAGTGANQTVKVAVLDYPVLDSIWQVDSGLGFVDQVSFTDMEKEFVFSNGTNQIRLKNLNQQGIAVYSNVLQYTKSEEEIIVFDADYMVLTYNFVDGRDLDTRTRIVVPDIGQDTIPEYLGWGVMQQFPAIDPIIIFGGDNTGTGKESVLIDIQKLATDFPSSTEIVADFRAFWFGQVGFENVSIQAVLYKGGTMIKDGFSWLNDTASDVLVFNSIGNTVSGPTINNANQGGQRISTFTYNLSTKVGIFDSNDVTTPEL